MHPAEIYDHPAYREAQLAMSKAVQACQELPRGFLTRETADLLLLYAEQATDAVRLAER